MKRSEAIIELMNYGALRQFFPLDASDRKMYLESEMLLDFIENELDMQPSFYISKHWHDQPVFSWEPEDEI